MLTSLLIIILSFLAFIEFLRLKKSRSAKHISGPPEIPIIGSKYVLFPSTVEKVESFLRELQKGPIAKVFLGPVMIIFVADPHILKDLLNHKDCLNRPYMFEFFHGKAALLGSRDEYWKSLRKHMKESFSVSVVNGFIPCYDKHFRDLVTTLESKLGPTEFNLLPFAAKTYQKAFSEALMEDYQQTEYSLNDLNLLIKIMSERTQTVFHHLDFIYKQTKEFQMDTKIMTKLTTAVKRIRFHKEKEMSKAGYIETKRCLEKLLTFNVDGRTLSHKEIAENFVNLMIVRVKAYDITSNALCFTLLCLAANPEQQEKAYLEILNDYGTTLPDEFSSENLEKTPFLDVIINESLRLFPASPLEGRDIVKDVVLGGVHIPRGTTLIMNLFSLHRRNDIWGENADTFVPERFNHPILPYSYLPFTSGPRGCIGMRAANLALKIGLIRLLKNYRFKTSQKLDELQFKFGLSLSLTTGHLFTLEKR